MSFHDQPECLKGRWIKKQVAARRQGIGGTSRVYNYQMKILITLALRELYKGGYNKDVENVLMPIRDIMKRGYFDNE